MWLHSAQVTVVNQIKQMQYFTQNACNLSNHNIITASSVLEMNYRTSPITRYRMSQWLITALAIQRQNFKQVKAECFTAILCFAMQAPVKLLQQLEHSVQNIVRTYYTKFWTLFPPSERDIIKEDLLFIKYDNVRDKVPSRIQPLSWLRSCAYVAKASNKICLY